MEDIAMKKNRIEYRQLCAMGATAAQLDTYSNTDPLDIYEVNGIYIMRGVVDADNLTAADVLDYLNALAEDDDNV